VGRTSGDALGRLAQLLVTIEKLLAFIVVLTLLRVGLRRARRGPESHDRPLGSARDSESALNQALYFSFLAIVIGGPFVTLMCASRLGIMKGNNLLIASCAVAAIVSLPLVLLAARLSGTARYENFWRYFEKRSNSTRRRVVVTWIGVSSLLLLLAVWG